MKTNKWIIALVLALSSISVSAQRFGATPEDSVACIRNLSLYTEFFRQGDRIGAFEPWLEVLRTCPANHLNNFVRGVTIVRTKIAEETDPEARQELIDLLREVWRTRSMHFGNEGVNTAREAMEIMTFNPEKLQEAYQLMKRAIEELGVGNDHALPFFYFEYAMANERAGHIDKEEVFEVYDMVVSYLERILREQPGDTNVMQALTNLDIAFQPYATCDEIIPIYERRYEENKNDVVFLQKVTRVLDDKGCNDSELFFRATQDLHALSPSAKTAYLMAQMSNSRRQYSDVINYLRDHVDEIESERDRVRAYLLLAQAYMHESRYQDGRTAAQRALAINPHEGRAYIFIGLMYAQSARACGTDAQISQRAAFWAAVDKFRRAREVDPNMEDQASTLISMYVMQFPTGDDLFFNGIAEGSSYRVGCWIQENTTVRKRP